MVRTSHGQLRDWARNVELTNSRDTDFYRETVRITWPLHSGDSIQTKTIGTWRNGPTSSFDLDPWLDSLRRAASGRNAPAELVPVRRRIDNAIIEFCQRGQPRDLQDVLIAAGKADNWVSKSSIRDRVRPLANLSPNWARYADDSSTEFWLAARYGVNPARTCTRKA